MARIPPLVNGSGPTFSRDLVQKQPPLRAALHRAEAVMRQPVPVQAGRPASAVPPTIVSKKVQLTVVLTVPV